MQMSHPDAAVQILEKVEQTDPALFLAHLDLGILFTDAGRPQDALRELSAAAKLKPDDVNAHWRLGRLYRSMGKSDLAKSEFNKASSITKAADDALIDKISGPHANGKGAEGPAGAPTHK
jgi:tetratricopeptide (TPR) repeat protein